VIVPVAADASGDAAPEVGAAGVVAAGAAGDVAVGAGRVTAGVPLEHATAIAATPERRRTGVRIMGLLIPTR
jgi:hypothetical protein